MAFADWFSGDSGGGGGFGGGYDPFGAGNGGPSFGSYDPYGGYNLGGFGFNFPSLGGGGGGALASGVGSALGSFLGNYLNNGSGGGGGGTTINTGNGGTNPLDVLLQNPALFQKIFGALPGPGLGTGSSSSTADGSTPPILDTTNGFPDFLNKIFQGIFPNLGLGNFGGAKGPPGAATTPNIGNLLTSLLGLGNAGLGAFGAVNSFAQQDLNNQNKQTTADYLKQLLGQSQGGANYLLGQTLPQMQQLASQLGPAYQDSLTQSNNGLQAGFQGLSRFTSPTQTSSVPGLQGVFDQLGDLQGAGNYQLGNIGQLASGQTQPQQQGLAQALALAGGSQPGASALTNTALSLLQGGQSPLTASSQSAAISALLHGGMTQGLSSLTNPATALANGQNPGAQALLQRGLGITSQNPLLPLSQIISLTQNQAATGAQNQLNSLRRQLLDRTGVTGPAIAGGGQNELLSQLGDQAMQSQSKALSDALLGQQGLQLQQFGQGAGLASTGLSSQLQGQALGQNTLLQQASQALQNQTGLGGLGNSGLNTYLSQLGLGGSLVGQGSQTQLGGLGALGSLLGQQTGATNAFTNLLGQNAQIGQGVGGDLFNLQNLGLNQNSQMYNALSSLLGHQGNQSNNLLNGLNTTAGYGFNASQNLQGQLPGFASSLASLYGGQGPNQNPISQPLGSPQAISQIGLSTGGNTKSVG